MLVGKRLGCVSVTGLVLAAACSDTSSSPGPIARSSSAITTVATPTIASFVVYAANNVTLGTGDHSVGGNIGVGSSNGTSPQLVVGAQDGLDLLHTLYAPAISIGNLAQVGAVETNSLTNNGGQVGTQSAYPLPMPPLPTIFPATPGPLNVTVAAGPPQMLTPGNYGTLTDNGILQLEPGTYSFASVTLGNNAQLQALQGGSTNILVSGKVSTGTFCQIFPVGQQANALLISVGGSDAPSGSPAAVALGANSQIIGLLAAPSGSLSFGNNVQATGAFAGLNFTAGTNVILNFQDGLASQAPSISTFVAYAERSISLSTNVQSRGGDFGVAATAPASFGPQITVGGTDNLDPTHALCAPTVSLAQGAQVGDIETSNLTNSGGTFRALVPYVVAGMPPMPLVLVGTPNTTPVTVAAGQNPTLTPGQYGNVTDDGTLNLQSGTYSFGNVTLGSNAQIIAGTGGATTIQIAGTLTTGQFAQILPLGQQAGALQIYVSGSDGPSGTPPAANVGPNNQVIALLAAPNGTVSLGASTILNGAISGFDVAVGAGAVLNFQSGFPTAAAGPHGSQQLTGYFGLPPDPTVAPLVGPVPPSTTVALDIGLPIPNLPALQTFVQNVADPTNALYRQYPTSVSDFATQYGPKTSDYQNVVMWAQGVDLTVINQFANNMLLSVSGTASQVEQALFVNLVYRQRYDGSSFITVDRDPSVNLSTTLLEINGLDDFILPAPMGVNATGCDGNYAPVDLRQAYLGSNCQAFLGDNETVGILSLENVQLPSTDLAAFDARQSPMINPMGNLVSVAYVAGGLAAFQSSSQEGIGDVEAVQAIAPNANIVLFEGKTGVFSHADAVLHQMATWVNPACSLCNTIGCCSPFLSTATNSYGFAKSKNAQQALYEMAAQGTSFFVASGDYGDIGDPGDCTDFDAQTVVGGTTLSTNPLVNGAYPTTATPPAAQCGPSSCYYASETTWNDGQPGNDITAGGLMDGVQDPFLADNLPPGTFGSCHCFPYPSCCPSGVPTPLYQQNLSQVSSEASNIWRNYPDVSMHANGIDAQYNGACSLFAGTSAASPMWAGVMALADELSDANHTGHVGFANPVLYGLGYSRGQPLDLYKTSFNDIADGSNNSPPGKSAQYTAVPGYDMATGWGSPTCNLVLQLGTSTPYTSHQPLSHLDLILITGGDDLRNDSTGTITINFQNGQSINYQLKVGSPSGADWNNGYFYEQDIDLGLCTNSSTVCQGGPISPPPTLTGNNVASVTLNLVESQGNSSSDEDNWDLSGISLRLFAPGSLQEVCQLDRPGSQLLQDGNYGVNRFSATPGVPSGTQASGNGPTFTIQGGTGCSSAGFPSPTADDINGNQTWYGLNEAAVPASSAGIQFIFATGKDGLRSDSGASVDIYDTPSGPAIQHIDIKDQNYYGGFPDDSSQNVVYPFTGTFDSSGIPLIDHIVINVDRNSDPCNCGGNSICEGFCTLDADQWKLSGLNVNTWQPNNPETCWMATPQLSGVTDDTTVLTMNSSQTVVAGGCLGK
jgi:hypothetical protein